MCVLRDVQVGRRYVSSRLSAEQRQNGLSKLNKSVDEGHRGARGRLPEKEAIEGKGGDLATTLRTCSKASRFSPSQEEEEGLPLPAGKWSPHKGPTCLLPSEDPVPCDREVARWQRGGAPGDQLATAGGDGGCRPAVPSPTAIRTGPFMERLPV